MKNKKNIVLKKVNKNLPVKKSSNAKPVKKGKLVVDLNPDFVVTPIKKN